MALDIRAYDPYSEQARRALHFDYWHHGVLTKKNSSFDKKTVLFGTFLLSRARKVPAIVFKVPNSILKCSQGFKVSKNVWLVQGHACLAGARELYSHFFDNLINFWKKNEKIIWSQVTSGDLTWPRVTLWAFQVHMTSFRTNLNKFVRKCLKMSTVDPFRALWRQPNTRGPEKATHFWIPWTLGYI